MYMLILSHYGQIHVSLHGMSTLLHPLLIILKKKFSLVLYATKCILIVCCILMCCPRCTSVFYCHVISFLTVTVLCLNVHIGYYIASVGNHRYVLDVDRFHNMLMYVSVILLVNNPRYKLILLTGILDKLSSRQLLDFIRSDKEVNYCALYGFHNVLCACSDGAVL